jgi:hypothetical protein
MELGEAANKNVELSQRNLVSHGQFFVFVAVLAAEIAELAEFEHEEHGLARLKLPLIQRVKNRVDVELLGLLRPFPCSFQARTPLIQLSQHGSRRKGDPIVGPDDAPTRAQLPSRRFPARSFRHAFA